MRRTDRSFAILPDGIFQAVEDVKPGPMRSLFSSAVLPVLVDEAGDDARLGDDREALIEELRAEREAQAKAANEAAQEAEAAAWLEAKRAAEAADEG